MNDLYTIEWDNGQPYIAHHGILGMKWGVRRYQNSDGTLTPEGRKRYGEKLGKEIYKIDKKYPGSDRQSTWQAYDRFDDAIRRNKAIKDFNNQNQNYKSMQDTHKEIKRIATDISNQVNQELEKKYGNFSTLSSAEQGNYIREGLHMSYERAHKSSQLLKLENDYKKYSKAYESDSREFLKEHGGDYFNKDSRGKARINVDLKTGKVSQSKILDIAAVEMLRVAGGKI